MADINVQPKAEEAAPQDDYTNGELIFWIIGILCIPMAPILMIWFLTPWSGM